MVVRVSVFHPFHFSLFRSLSYGCGFECDCECEWESESESEYGPVNVDKDEYCGEREPLCDCTLKLVNILWYDSIERKSKRKWTKQQRTGREY